MPGRAYSQPTNKYRYGFNGKEKDNEVKGTGNQLDFGARIYDSRISRWLSVDPQAALMPGWSPYNAIADNPIIYVDPNGQFPILVNGKVSSNSERGNWSYWNKNVRETVKARTGYYHSQFMYVDGDKGLWPSTRVKAGMGQGKTDAAAVYARLKVTMKDGKITEQLQVISHSRGGAFAQGYMDGLTAEVINLAAKDKIGFAYGKENIVEYSVNLAPHQSNWINYKNNNSKNVNVSHVGDMLSGNDATGNVINVQSIPEKNLGTIDQHKNGSYNTELNFILDKLEKNTDKSKLLEEIKAGYKNYDNNRMNGDKSKVTQGSN